jgi:hypothetical protein
MELSFLARTGATGSVSRKFPGTFTTIHRKKSSLFLKFVDDACEMGFRNVPEHA